MDPRHLSRLHEEQRRAIQETEERIGKYEKFKSDYKALQQRLKTLPDKISHEVMVPLGKFAFMPGQIVHTNEILVLLGDNWFAERSAKQAYHIAERRIQEIDKRIKDLQEQHDLLSPRLGFTSDLQDEAQGFADIKEIVEEFDEEKERLWEEQHRTNVRKHRAEQRMRNIKIAQEMKSDDLSTNTKDSKSVDDLWKRLDALEKEESEKGELHSSFEEDSDDEEIQKKKISGRRVSWIDEKKDDESSDEEASTENSTEDNEEVSSSPTEIKRTIIFSHTKTPMVKPKKTKAKDGSVIHSPADIYKLFAPKSILKKSPSVEEDQPVLSSVEESIHSSSKSEKSNSKEVNTSVQTSTKQSENRKEDPTGASSEKAFTGLVVEKSNAQIVQNKTEQQGNQQTKLVSKFKAQRMKQASS